MCLTEVSQSYRYGMTQGWENERISVFGWTVPKRKTGGGHIQTIKIPTDRRRDCEKGVLRKLSQSSVLDECNLMLSSDRECECMGLCWYWITAGRKAQNISTQSSTLSAEALQHGRNMAYSPYVPEQLRNWSMHTCTQTHAFIIDLPITSETAYSAPAWSALSSLLHINAIISDLYFHHSADR